MRDNSFTLRFHKENSVCVKVHQRIFVHEQRRCSCPTPGKFAFFKAKVVGTPTPKVTWARANGEIHFQPNVCSHKYDEASQEHTLEVSVFRFCFFF